MIYGKLDQAVRYMGILPGIDRILKEAGRYTPQDEFGRQIVLEGNDIYMNLAEYDTHERAEACFEAHRQYVDVMCMIMGEETIYVKPEADLQSTIRPYNDSADVLLARMEDDKEAEKRVAPKGLSLRRRYTGCGYSGPHINAWELRWEKIRSWNRVVREYRRGLLEDVRENICNCELHLDWRDAKNLRCQFTRIARLTEEEKELVFGALPESMIADGAMNGATTNAIIRVP